MAVSEYGDEVVFYHNDDFSGPIAMVVPAVRVEESGDGKSAKVLVDFDAIKYIVAKWVRQNLMEIIDEADTDELLLETTISGAA